MPSRAVTIDIRDKAQRTIRDAAATLSDRFGVVLEQSSIYDGKDQDYLRAKELERIGAFLAGLAAADSPELRALDKANAELECLKGEHTDCLAKLVIVVAERDALVQQVKSLLPIDPTDDTTLYDDIPTDDAVGEPEPEPAKTVKPKKGSS